ncbi:MAG TPA: TIGR00282 family metallophosphoesterase [Candidatus Hydrogenedentes bacterium]|nr:TIGR00282 family metallophosphoesterase [Candidatus Hydrogenedentota bacterium]HQH54572.1 TIGR00282 family metallophosphoesterase [Candidatus Hydrogenedentota bacterium]HQM48239.1 TIGR00282 family metallophosphoesterase [Candidatus Hydrogenedentota bacterium]
MNILFIGDIVGRPGRRSVARWLPRLRDEFAVDLVIANGENAAGGLGITPALVRELLEGGVQVITLGNHTWRKREFVKAIGSFDAVVRPANYPEGVPGKGFVAYRLDDGRTVGVVNLLGRVYMEPVLCPFAVGSRVVEELRQATPVVIVDMHAEATSEKVAMGWHLDGKCTAVIGTHTHVQTADERVLPGGTAYITDVGMTGPLDSVIGVERDLILRRFLTGMPVEFEVAAGRPALAAVVVDADDETGKARSIRRLLREDPDNE